MKKILFMVMLCVSLISCTDGEDIKPMVTLSFSQQVVSGSSMTRATTNEFLDIIEEQTPDYLNVALKNTDLGKTFYCKSNETITIPIGNYEISGDKIDGCYIKTDNLSYYNKPILKIDKFTAKIDNETQSIKLDAYYNCYALFALTDECKLCSFTETHGKYYVAYFNGDANVTLTPYEDSEEFIETTFELSPLTNVDCGKYYVLHPNKSDKTNPSFDFNVGGMEGGEI